MAQNQHLKIVYVCMHAQNQSGKNPNEKNHNHLTHI